MNPTKRLAGPCGQCGRTIEYPAHLVGTLSKCPYCGEQTELVLETPTQESWVTKRVVIFTVITAVILVLGLAACFIAFKMAESRSGHQKQATPAPVQP